MTMKKAWNIANLPVYSLATYHERVVNMNICTYVTAVSMTPKLFAVAVYENTKTLDNLRDSDIAVLQLLAAEQYPLVRKLGQQSGFEYSKADYLNRRKLLEQWQSFPVLKEVSARFLLRRLEHIPTGDHHLFIFEVTKSQSISLNHLQLQHLRERKIIRG